MFDDAFNEYGQLRAPAVADLLRRVEALERGFPLGLPFIQSSMGRVEMHPPDPAADAEAIVKVTSAATQAVTLAGGSINCYPAVLESLSAAGAWSDGATCWFYGANGETPTNGTRYLTRQVQADTGGKGVFAVQVPAAGGTYGICSAFYQNNSNSQVLPLANVNLPSSGPSITLTNYTPTGQSNILGADGSGNLAVLVTGEFFFWINMTLTFTTLVTAPPGLLSVLMGNWNGNNIRKEFPLGNGPTGTVGGNGVMYTTQGPFFSQALAAPQTLALSMANGTGTAVTLGAVEIYAERVL